MRSIVLGHTGMLGHMVASYLSEDYEVVTTESRWPDENFKSFISGSDADFLVNCAGSIPQRKSEFSVNSELPVWLDQNFRGKIIHPGTDCEKDESEYGLSKRKASEWIVSEGKRTKIIMSSVVGPEMKGSSSLLGWFLSHPDGSEVNGFTNHLWNGVTTLRWARHASAMMEDWDYFETVSAIGTFCVSKYELLLVFNEVYERKIVVREKEGPPVDKCLELRFNYGDIETQLREMRDFEKAA